MLHTIFSFFDDIVSKTGVEKIKTMGDGYQVISGIPEPTDDHADRLVETAYLFIKATKALNQTRNYPELKPRIGIHTGALVAGVVRGDKISYDAWGNSMANLNIFTWFSNYHCQ